MSCYLLFVPHVMLPLLNRKSNLCKISTVRIKATDVCVSVSAELLKTEQRVRHHHHHDHHHYYHHHYYHHHHGEMFAHIDFTILTMRGATNIHNKINMSEWVAGRCGRPTCSK